MLSRALVVFLTFPQFIIPLAGKPSGRTAPDKRKNVISNIGRNSLRKASNELFDLLLINYDLEPNCPGTARDFLDSV